MKMKYILLVSFTLLLAQRFLAQSITFPEEKDIKLRDIRPIVLFNEVKGYYVFSFETYATDWGGDATSTLIVMDVNFKITKDLTLVTPKAIKQISFNGSHFCMVMKDGRFVEYYIYDMEGALVGKRKHEYDDTDKPDKEVLKDIMAVPYKGFIRTGILKGQKNYFEMFDANGQVVWRIDPKEYQNNKQTETEDLYVLELNDYHIIFVVNHGELNAREAKTRNISFQRVYNIQSGAEFCDLNGTDMSAKILYGAMSEPNEITLYGVHFPGGTKGLIGDVVGGEKYGLYFQVFDETGKLMHEYRNDGQEELKAILEQIPEAEYDEYFNLWIHHMVKAQGNYYVIGELFSSKPRTIRNMVVLKFDGPQSEPQAYVFKKQIPDKDLYPEVKNVVHYNLGNNFFALHYFEYRFTTLNKDQTIFSTIYMNNEIVDKKDVNKIVGAIALDREGQLVNPKILLESKPDEVYLLPAKTGYIAVAEFFKNDKRLSLTLHKFDF
jgi:hypothetical protein